MTRNAVFSDEMVNKHKKFDILSILSMLVELSCTLALSACRNRSKACKRKALVSMMRVTMAKCLSAAAVASTVSH